MHTALKKPFVAFAAVTVASVGVAAPSTAASSSEARHAAQVSSASAAKPTPWSPWKPEPKSKPYTIGGCGTELRISEPFKKQEARHRTDRDGNFRLQFRGALHWRINPDRGHTVIVDISGPGRLIFYRNGDTYIQGTGRNAFYFYRAEYRNSTPTKLPRLFLSTGTFDVFLDSQDTRRLGDDQVTVLDQPTRYWNICSILRSGVVPKPFRV